MRVSELRAKRIIADEIVNYEGTTPMLVDAGNLDLGGTLDVTGVTTLDDNLIVGASAFTVAAASGNTACGTLVAAGEVTAAEGIVVDATAVGGVKVLLQDAAGDALFATGTTVPVDTTAGYAKGCLFIDTDVASGTTGLYCNKGTNASCVFTAVTQA